MRCHKKISRGLDYHAEAPLLRGITEIYTTKEFAEKLNVSEIWIRELARKGRIYPARRVGRNWGSSVIPQSFGLPNAGIEGPRKCGCHTRT
jgi:excisionase family DNA binding protein